MLRYRRRRTISREPSRNAAYIAGLPVLPAKAVVIGTEIPPTIASLAERESVHCIAITNKGARPR